MNVPRTGIVVEEILKDSIDFIGSLHKFYSIHTTESWFSTKVGSSIINLPLTRLDQTSE